MKVEKAPRPAVFPDASGKKFAIIAATFYADLAAWMEDGARRGLRDCGVADDAIEVFSVPGCFELPVAARRLIRAGDYDGILQVVNLLQKMGGELGATVEVLMLP